MMMLVRRRTATIVLAVCVLVGIGVVASWPGPKEPNYNGKSFSEWLWIIGTNSTTDRQIINDSADLSGITNELPKVIEAVRAVRAIGTNALPHLIKWTLDPPAWRRASLKPIGRGALSFFTATRLEVGSTAKIQINLPWRSWVSKLWALTRFMQLLN